MTAQDLISVIAAFVLVVLSWLSENWRILAALGIGVAVLIGFLVVSDRIGHLEQAVWILRGRIKERQEKLDELEGKVDELCKEVREQGNKLDDIDEKVDALQSSVSDLVDTTDSKADDALERLDT